MSKSFYNNASVKCKKSVDSAMTIKSNIVKKEERNINNMQNNLASMIKEKKLFLLDIDGTVALGSELLPGAADFLQTVKENGGIFRFLTNNSSKAASDYVEQFHDWGIECRNLCQRFHEEILRKRKNPGSSYRNLLQRTAKSRSEHHRSGRR